ncbi:MAG: hypothetical protein K2K21_04615 [Lachnospiraceae bacterium]|nr:hypothetical protein [Lachnospiraceae bacterium]
MDIKMSHIILGTGNYAKIPYFFDKTYVNLYSLEELCFCLVENAEFVDNSITDDKLADWLGGQCGLTELAHTLQALTNKKASVDVYVGTILEYAGLYSREVIEHTEMVIRNNEGLSPYEKQKAKADYMLQNKHYTLALERYDELLARLPEEKKELRGSLLHNMGVIYAKLFMFELAQEKFMEAYRASGNPESLEQFLAARRMQDSDSEYVDYIAGHPELHEVSMKIEHMVEQAAEQFDATQVSRMLFTLKVCKEEGGLAAGNMAYYDEIEKLTDELKDAYREKLNR